MSTLIIDNRDVSLDYEAYCLLIRQPEQPLRSVPLARLERIICMCNVTVSTRLIGQCQKLGVDFITLNSRYSSLSFSIYANQVRQVQRRIFQYAWAKEPLTSLPLARRLVAHKLMLTQHAIQKNGLKDSQSLCNTFKQRVRHVLRCENSEQLRGYEGSAQRQAFEYWRQCLPERLGFTSRQRRPPPDPVNSLLSLTFTLLHEEAVRQSLVHGLDPWLGFYHCAAPGRLSLACDLMEPLRPAAEAWVVRLFTENLLDKRHFTGIGENCLLSKSGRDLFYPLWQLEQPNWTRRLGRYAQLLARHLDSCIEKEPLMAITMEAA